MYFEIIWTFGVILYVERVSLGYFSPILLGHFERHKIGARRTLAASTGYSYHSRVELARGLYCPPELDLLALH